MEAGNVLGVAEIKGVDPTCILQDPDAQLRICGGPVIPGAEIFAVTHKNRAAAGFAIAESHLPRDLVAACLIGELRASAVTKANNGIVTITAIGLERSRDFGGTCWTSDMSERSAPYLVGSWFGEVSLAALASRRNVPAPLPSRPHGRGEAARLNLTGPIRGRSAALLVDAIGLAKFKTIALTINSPGGSAAAGFDIYRALSKHAHRVEVAIGERGAHSAASIVAMAGDVRRIDLNATMLVHQSFVDGKHVRAGNVEKVAKSLRRSVDDLAAVYAARTGKPISTTERWMSNDTRFTALEALRAGLVHEVTKGDAVILRQADVDAKVGR